MMSFSPQKLFDFFFIVVSAFVVAMAGNYFFEWDFQFGLTIGIILGVWTTLYDMGTHILGFMEDDEDDDEEIKEEIMRSLRKK